MKNALFLPAYNEEKKIERCVLELKGFLQDTDIIIADNNSIDRTAQIGKELAKKPGIEYFFTEKKGKGAAIREAWKKYEYDTYAFIDVDLSPDYYSYPRLIHELGDMVIGSRYLPESKTTRSRKREIVSYGYRTLFNLMFGTHISDPQCGFKAISRKTRDIVVPKLKEDGFFFDTELILQARAAGLEIKEIPIRWKEKGKSRIKLRKTVPYFFKKLVQYKLDGF